MQIAEAVTAVKIAVHIRGKHPDSLIFESARGRALRASNFRVRVFVPARAATGLGALHPHELRHTAASLAIDCGANVKLVQSMLGHKSATLTLDLYGHLFADQHDTVADAMDAAARAATGLRAQGEPAKPTVTIPDERP